jgi:ElaB/YqjD/DUF883 family membrane-anchored ribosome-binding protein
MNQEGSKEKLLSDFKVLVDDTEALLKATANQAGERISAARHCIEQSLETSKKTLAAAQETALGKTKDIAEAADGCVRKNPWSAVGIAAGVGLLLGLLLRRG